MSRIGPRVCGSGPACAGRASQGRGADAGQRRRRRRLDLLNGSIRHRAGTAQRVSSHPWLGPWAQFWSHWCTILVSVAVRLLMHPRCRQVTALLVSDACDVLNEFCGLAVSRDALTVNRAVCAAERRSVRPLAAASRNRAHGCLPTGLSSEEAVMKYARVPRPEAPAGPLSAGIDWASADHAVCIVDAAGAVVSRFTVAHTAEGLKTLVSRLARAGAAEVAIECGDGPAVDALM